MCNELFLVREAFRKCHCSSVLQNCKRRILLTIQNMVEASFISRLSKLIFILLPEAVTSWEEIPAPFLVHLPDVRFLK